MFRETVELELENLHAQRAEMEQQLANAQQARPGKMGPLSGLFCKRSDRGARRRDWCFSARGMAEFVACCLMLFKVLFFAGASPSREMLGIIVCVFFFRLLQLWYLNVP